MRWDRSCFPVREVMVAALDGLLPVLAEKDIKVVRQIDCPGTEVLADRDRIQQVISNLIENAVKFSSKGKRIWVGCREAASSGNGGPWLEISVREGSAAESLGVGRDAEVRVTAASDGTS